MIILKNRRVISKIFFYKPLVADDEKDGFVFERYENTILV